MPPQQTDVTSEAERDAARLIAPSITATRSIPSLLQRCWHAFLERRLRQSLRTSLQDLSDRELIDIGLTRAELDYITGQRGIDTLRDSTRHLWGRGVM